MSFIHGIIRLRRGTAAEWSASTPQPGGEVLKLGEPGYEKDTGRLKIGDGVTPWNSLSYFNDGASIDPEVIQDILGSGFLVAGTGISISYNDSLDNLTISTSGVAFSVHTHTSSDITNFDTAVSGLIPVKDIVAGTGVGVTSSSGIYTINSSNTIATDTLEPDGFINRTDSQITFNNGSREFSISPKAPATSYGIYNNGIKVTKNSTETIALPNSTALYYIHFDKSDNSLSYKTTGIDFSTDIPIAQIYYNSNDGKAVYFGEERHGIRMDAATHKYLHNVFGTQYINGLSISNYTLTGTGSSNSDATVAIGDGVIYDEDIEANITHSDTPSNPFEQVLYPIAQIPVYYRNGATGAWTDTVANDYPVKTGTTIQYNLDTAGTWSAANSTNPTNNRYIAYWICATTQENAPIISIMGQRIDSSIEQATSNNAWGDLNLTGLPIVELRPLYRLIYDTKNTFTNTPKGLLADVLDIRSHIDTVTGLTQNDHGSLYGLADDDHYQYVHIDNARTIDAVHTFTNGLNTSGILNATSGNFSSLTVNSTGVSLEGHTHTAGNITDFNSSVSGVINTSLSTDIIAGTGVSITYDNINDDLIISSNGLFSVVNLGTLTGTNGINGGINNSIQTLTLNGTATTFVKGNGWPTTSSTSTDTVLRITVTTATTITWTIVTDWFNQPPTGALSIGTHLFLLRGIGSSIVEGHYIGNKTN